MDKDFQDRIDEYLLHGERMSEEEKTRFLHEVEEDAEKKEQLELTQHVKQAIASREEKLKVMAHLQRQYEQEHRGRVGCSECAVPTMQKPVFEKTPSRNNVWWWVSGVAVVLVAGFFVVRPMFVMESEEAPIFKELPDGVRGGDEIFGVEDFSIGADSVASDTVFVDTLK